MLDTNRNPRYAAWGPRRNFAGALLTIANYRKTDKSSIALNQQCLPAHMATHSIDMNDNSQNLCNFAYYVQQAVQSRLFSILTTVNARRIIRPLTVEPTLPATRTLPATPLT
jgi:hypothetical protein